MFDFIFRRKNSAPVSEPTVAAPAAKNPPPAMERKQAAIARAEALDGDEAAAVEFILQCEFADARAIAAQHVQSAPLLEQVLRPMRKIDRRVARLMQQRLDAIAQQQLAVRQAQACIDGAQQLLGELHLLPNQVAELDRGWQAIAAVGAAECAQYEPLRAALDARLLAQSALQRTAIDTLARLRQLQETAVAAMPLPPAEEVARALAILEGAMENHLAAPEAASLPRHIQADFERQCTAFRVAWQRAQQQEQALGARRQALAEWEAAAATLSTAELQSAWQALPPVDGAAAAAVEQQFQALLAKLAIPPIPSKIRQRAPRRDSEPARQQVLELLPVLESALQQGALQEATDCDSALGALDLKAAALPAAQAARLNAARAELARLQGWARWGGNVSRAELLKTVQELPDRKLAVSELARQVGALRARWKALDATAGGAPRELWQQFDAACTVAYAPAAEHFSRQAEQRRAHLEQAEALLAQVGAYGEQLERAAADAAAADGIDWKAAAAFCTRMQQAWHRLGSIERKEKKRLDRAFEDALQAVRQPLARQQAAAALRREQLIAAALELDPTRREAPDALRALQQRWQEMAQALPLEHKQEQQLWQRFRAACDGVFAQRKQASANADQERRHNLQQKEALCLALEAARGQVPASMQQTIADHQAAWSRIGAVPRALEPQIDARRQAALAALQAELQQARRGAFAAGFEALRAKLALCRQLEQQLTDGQPLSATQREDAQARWQALAPLAAEFDVALGARFDAACSAAQSAAAGDYAARLDANRARLLNEILQLEILTGTDSPPQWSRQRLQLQVEVLAAKLKNGDGALAAHAQLLSLCALPALADAEAGARIERLLAKCAELQMTGVALQADNGHRLASKAPKIQL